MPMQGLAPMLGSVFLEKGDVPGRYKAETDLSMSGGWQLKLDWDGPSGRGTGDVCGNGGVIVRSSELNSSSSSLVMTGAIAAVTGFWHRKLAHSRAGAAGRHKTRCCRGVGAARDWNRRAILAAAGRYRLQSSVELRHHQRRRRSGWRGASCMGQQPLAHRGFWCPPVVRSNQRNHGTRAQDAICGWVAWLAGALSGLLGGLVGNQGGIRSAALLGFNLSKANFVERRRRSPCSWTVRACPSIC